jgi:spermidine synthase
VSSLELVPDEDGRGGVTVMLDGSPQSYVDLRDPGHLAFEYVQHIAAVVDTLAPGPLGVTHVGGAGLTLARYVNAERPGSTQIVLEPDEALTEAVRRDLPLPRRHRIRVRPVDGLRGVAGLSDAGADVVVLDAYAGGRVPAELTTLEFLRDVRRVLRPSGVALLNVADEPGLRFVARVVAGAREAFGSVALIATHEVLKGKRFGNLVLLGSVSPVDLWTLRRATATAALPTGVLSWDEVERRRPGARPFSAADGDTASSPEPPERGAWRRH